MPFSKIFNGELTYNIEYDMIDPNNLFDEVAMAVVLEELPEKHSIFPKEKTPTSCDDEKKKKTPTSCDDEKSAFDGSTSNEEKKRKKRKRKVKDISEPDPNVVRAMNELTSFVNSGDLVALKVFVEKHFDVNCCFLTSTTMESVCGREHIYKCFESTILLHPEQVLEFQNYTKECDNSMYFTLSYEGTYYDPENKSVLTHGHQDDKTDVIDSSLWQSDHVSGHKFAQDEESNRNKFANLLQMHKPVEVVARGCSRIFFEIIDEVVVISDVKVKWKIKKVEESSITM